MLSLCAKSIFFSILAFLCWRCDAVVLYVIFAPHTHRHACRQSRHAHIGNKSNSNCCEITSFYCHGRYIRNERVYIAFAVIAYDSETLEQLRQVLKSQFRFLLSFDQTTNEISQNRSHRNHFALNAFPIQWIGQFEYHLMNSFVCLALKTMTTTFAVDDSRMHRNVVSAILLYRQSNSTAIGQHKMSVHLLCADVCVC